MNTPHASRTLDVKGKRFAYIVTREGWDITTPEGRTIRAIRSPSGDGGIVAPHRDLWTVRIVASPDGTLTVDSRRAA